MNPQFNKGILELCVLALVSRKERYGYELVELISSRIDISEGTIYPILKRLTEEDYFETYLQESKEGPPRKYYRITAKGRRVCHDGMRDWQVFIRQVDTLLKEGEGK